MQLLLGRQHTWPIPALRKRLATTAQTQDSKVVNGRSFFDREMEQAKLLDRLEKAPSNMLLVLGPLSSGKTRLLREVLLSGKLDTPVSWFSGRYQKLSDASVMAEALTRELAAQLTALEKLGEGLRTLAVAAINTSAGLDIKAPDGNETLKLKPGSLLATDSPNSSAINTLISAFEALLTTRKENSGSPPVICIDEANVLMEWNEEVKVGFFVTEVIGDFPEPEARKFFQGLMSNNRELTDKEWASIFEVCGGNAGSLVTSSQLVESSDNVQAALKVIWREPFDAVKSGLTGDFPWRTEQYRTMLRLICESDHAAVIATDAYLELKPGGKEAVQAMVKADLLAYRPASEWAQDIPLEAFGPRQEAVLTAPSATHLYCMRLLQSDGDLKTAAEAASSKSWSSRLRMWAARLAGAKKE